MALLSKNQKNAIRILRFKYIEAREAYIQAVEIRITIFNCEPNKVKDFLAWQRWRNRFKLATDDMLKCFDNFNKAFNSYRSYKSVALGVY